MHLRFLLWICLLRVTNSKKQDDHHVQAETIECEIMQLDVELAGDGSGSNDQAVEEVTYVCVTDRNDIYDQSYTIDIPPIAMSMVEEHAHPIMTISNVHVDTELAHINVEEGPVDISVVESNDPRKLAQKTGNSDVLVLRVTYLGREPTLSLADLAGSVFGLGSKRQIHSMVSQFEACSFGQLKMRPASGIGITNGVADISIDKRVSSGDEVVALDNAVVDKANSVFGRLRDQYDHVIMVFPQGLRYLGSENWLAYGYLNGWRSVYQDFWAGSLSALMHETGHNLDLHHAGKGREHYGDTSGYMGWGTTIRGEPTSCFNAQKSFDLGWYNDRVVSLQVDDLPWGGYLAFFGEYDLTSTDQPVIVNIGSRNDRLFMQYNRAKGINAQTRVYPDQVVIVADTGDTTRWGEQSWFEGAIGVNEHSTSRNYRVQHFEGGQLSLLIRVCEQVDGSPDYVRMSIHLEDGSQSHTCNDNLFASEPATFCDDDMTGSFFVDDSRGFKNCGWLVEKVDAEPGRFDYLCLEGESARDVCQETCGKCSDTCEDRADVDIYINDRHGYQNCKWLSTRAPWIEKLCVSGNDAYRHCTETCDICD